jgi:hypothetical protein
MSTIIKAMASSSRGHRREDDRDHRELTFFEGASPSWRPRMALAQGSMAEELLKPGSRQNDAKHLVTRINGPKRNSLNPRICSVHQEIVYYLAWF